MKSALLSFVLVTLSLAGAGAQAIQDRQNNNDEVIVYRLPEPRQVFILRGDNNVVYKASIPAASVVNNSFILPDNARAESLAVSEWKAHSHVYYFYRGRGGSAAQGRNAAPGKGGAGSCA